jgi:hypothetical protein
VCVYKCVYIEREGARERGCRGMRRRKPCIRTERERERERARERERERERESESERELERERYIYIYIDACTHPHT